MSQLAPATIPSKLFERLESDLRSSGAAGEVSIYVGRKKGASSRYRWWVLNVDQSLSQSYLNRIADNLGSTVEREFRSYVEYSGAADEVCALPTEGDDGLRDFIQSFPNALVVDELDLSSVGKMAGKLNLVDFKSAGGARYRLFTKGVDNFALRGNGILAQVGVSSTKLSGIDGDILYLPADLRFFELNSMMFVIDEGVFESSANYMEKTYDLVREYWSRIVAWKRVRVANLERLEAEVFKGKQLAKKIAKHGVIEDPDPEVVLQCIEEYKLGFDVELTGDTLIITADLESHEARKKLVRFLVQNLVRGAFDSRPYIVDHKRVPR